MATEIREARGYALCLPPVDFDLLDPRQVDAQLAQYRPDAVLHLAAQSNVAASFQDPEGTFRVNLTGTLRLLEGLRRAKLSPAFLFVSSGDVYGRVSDSEPPISEDRHPQPRNPYAVSKAAAEMLCLQWAMTEALPIKVARPFNHIGRGQSDSFVLPAFARQVAEIHAGRREPIVDVGDIDVTRDFSHVADVVEAYLSILENGKVGEIYNVASGESFLIRELLAKLKHLAGVSASDRQDPTRFRPAEQRTVRASNGKLRGLGWRPKRSIDDALGEIMDEWKRRITNG